MGFRIREIEVERKFSSTLTMDAFGQAVPRETIGRVLERAGVREQRERKLTLVMVVFVLIAMNLYVSRSIGSVVRKVAQGLRLLWADVCITVAGDSAIAYRRAQLGAPPLVALFHEVCRPIAIRETPGAFLFGLRVMAIDGTTEDVADTPANVAVFGRHRSGRGASAFPQLKGVYLVECGTHVIVDAGFWPCHCNERVGGKWMLRSVEAGMLVMWDNGFHDYDMLYRASRRGAQVLGRLPSYVKPTRVRRLSDGSYLGYLRPSEYRRRKRGERLLVRIIEYTITDPALPGYREHHRLVTTLLDPQHAPALQLACAYHERWEIELVIDEIDTHQRLAMRVLRSLTPVGVIQELYALLIAHYAIRFLMHQAALRAGVDPDRLSFVHALRVLQDAIPEFQLVAPEELGRLYERMLHDIGSYRLPDRRPRSNPRVVKRKMSKFPLKHEQHRCAPKPRGPLRDAVEIVSPEPISCSI